MERGGEKIETVESNSLRCCIKKVNGARTIARGDLKTMEGFV